MWVLTKYGALVLLLPIITYQLTFEYLNHNDLIIKLRNLTETYPEISRWYDIGQSHEERMLDVVEITSDIKTTTSTNGEDIQATLKPQVKLIGNIHGHSTGGRQLLLNLVEYLLENYGHDEHVTKLVNTTKIHVLCSMNPDGFERRSGIERIIASNKNPDFNPSDDIGRTNNGQIDLNLDFDWKSGKSINNQFETTAVIEWLNMFPFVLSASFFSDELVVSYPFYEGDLGDVNALTPDDIIFRKISKSYSQAHNFMSKAGNKACNVENQDKDHQFIDGIANGAAWKPLSGTMADYNYHRKKCLEISVHLGCQRWIPPGKLSQLWEENRKALLAFIGEVHMGVKGIIMSNDSSPIANARVRMNDSSKEARLVSWKTGEYWKLLMPGQYVIVVSANNHHEKTVTVNVTEGLVSIVNITLLPYPYHNTADRSVFGSSTHALLFAITAMFASWFHGL